jgi:predicted O-linked N-acetylglucosamine transferase (SPINDLY family)
MATISEAYQMALRLHREGKPEVAEQIYRNILAVEPGHAQSWHLLGVAAVQRSEYQRAAEYIERAIALDASRAAFFANLGIAYRQLGRLAEAETALRRALTMEPQFANAHCTLGLVLCDMDRANEGIPHLQRAIELKPNDSLAAVGLAFALNEVGCVDEAMVAYRYAYDVSPSPKLRLAQATLLPLVYRSADDLRAWRRRFEQQVSALADEGLRIDLATEPSASVFNLAYQAFNDRLLQQKLAGLHRAPADAPLERNRPGRADGRIHVAFISSHFNRHTIGKLQRGMIAQLSRNDFFVSVLSAGRHQDQDDVAEFIRSHADQYVELPGALPEARRAIGDLRPDVLYYCDIGMDSLTYSLAFSRLAPVQCVTWGHPLTTGIPTMDYFISSRLMEPPDGAEHYTEKLVPLDSLSIYYYRPPEPPPARREDFGLHPDAHLYVCPQSIYKFHPEYDRLLGEILRRDPLGRLVLIRWAYPHSDDLLRERFATVMPDVLDRIDFIPRLQQSQFVSLLGLSDVLLDPIHFGGGHTSLDALALGTPVVTLPGQFLRGRITMGLYRKMGLMECVASEPDHYVAIAVHLGTDPDYRRRLSERIREANAALFEDRDSVVQLEAFFRQAVANRP